MRRLWFLLLLASLPAMAQQSDAAPDLTWHAEGAAGRFVAVHGRRAAIFGYGQRGLEVWASPLQLLSEYHVDFRVEGSPAILLGTQLLRSVDYRPDAVVRTYAAPDFSVRETLFVPLNKPGATIEYEVEGRSNVQLAVSYVPSLNLMWPGALGGQDVQWSPALSGYILSEPLRHWQATISSPEAVEHTATVNRAILADDKETMVLRPHPDAGGPRKATLVVAADAPGTAPGTLARELTQDRAALHAELTAHTHDVLQNAMTIETPDPDVNRALAWTTLALDQAWACNAELGCGELAGYGPSRRGRRPQYAWYFDGDGLQATDAWIAAGDYAQARAELEFLLRYQNPENGMMWHEISPGVPLDQWRKLYPYMYVHVDITFQFLPVLARYVQASGDIAFLRAHRNAFAAAYRACTAVIDPQTGLPRIPAGSEGANEQERLSDDLGLSAAWILAAEASATLATMLGDATTAEHATAAAEAARRAVARLDWDQAGGTWVQGHTISGEALHTLRPGPLAILHEPIFSPEQSRRIVDKIVSPDFLTDWGVRNLSASSPGYDPGAYGAGSVSALGTAEIAEALWSLGWEPAALQLWERLLPWSSLDSEGHIHELLAGDLYQPEVESVPEQTWSSAGLLTATVRGLLGVSVDGAAHALTFAPHLMPAWPSIRLKRVRVADTLVNLELRQGVQELALEADTQAAAPVVLHFAPQLPLGAHHVQATCQSQAGKQAAVAVKPYATSMSNRAELTVPWEGRSVACRLQYRGGVTVEVPYAAPTEGSSSHQLELAAAEWHDNVLTLSAFSSDAEHSTLTLRTGMRIDHVEGASLQRTGPRAYALQLPQPKAATVQAYRAHTVTVQFSTLE